MGTQLPLKGAQPPIFGPCLLWPNGWTDEDSTRYGSTSRPRPHCVRRGPSSPAKGHVQQPPPSSACVYSILWQRSPISATAELLFWYILILEITAADTTAPIYKNSSGDEIANVNFLRCRRKSLRSLYVDASGYAH